LPRLPCKYWQTILPKKKFKFKSPCDRELNWLSKAKDNTGYMSKATLGFG